MRERKPIEIGATKRLFDIQEAEALMPLVRSITERHQLNLAPIQARLNKTLSNDPRRRSYEQEYEAVVLSWRTKLEKLGVIIQGLWVVEFEVGQDGYLSWKHPELSLNHFRPRECSLTARVKLKSYIEEHDPDWSR